MVGIERVRGKKPWSISLLSKHHHRANFDCGDDELNNYLKYYAGQHIKQHMSKTFVASPIDCIEQVLGFYALSAGHIVFEELLSQWQKKLPRYPIPIARIGRLAINQQHQGEGIGEYLLMDALYRCASLIEQIGLVGVVVDAKHESAKAFYQKFGFVELTYSPLTLVLPITNILDSII